jgi:bacterial/archaeal transporter family-2 protein
MNPTGLAAYAMLVAFALLAGAILPAQAGINAQLARRLGHPALAATASFVVGTVALIAYCLAARPPVPSFAQARQVPLWLWTGGLLGTYYVVSNVMLAPRLGASAMIAVIIAGQMLCSLALDHFGAIGFAEHPVNLARVGGAVLLMAGVALILRY